MNHVDPLVLIWFDICFQE